MIEPSQWLATILLAARVFGAVYLIRVVRIQQTLIQHPAVDEYGRVDEGVMAFRRLLSRLTLVVLWGQAVPILIDITNVINAESPFWMGALYAISNAFTALAAAVLIFKLYEMATNVKEANELARVHTQERHDQEISDME